MNLLYIYPNMDHKAALSQLKKNKKVTLVYDRPNLDIFTTINRGDNFRVKSCWKIDTCNELTYVISFTNSYRLTGGTGGLKYRPRNNTFSYFCCYIALRKSVPYTIIHPLSSADKVMNLLFHQNIKLNNKPVFNKKYLLQSVDKDGVVKILSDELISVIESNDELFLEIRENKCLIYYLRPPLENDGLIFACIAEKFDDICKEP